MLTQQLGTTGVEVSSLCLGTMYFGNRDSKETSYEVLDKYFELGGRFLDTSNMYACWVEGYQGGESESLIGQWMRDRGNRNEIFIATKVGQPRPGVEPGLSAKQIEEECEKSLKRLGIETIDLYYSHRDDPETPIEETMGAYDQLIQAGKVRFLGASNFYSWRLERANAVSASNHFASYCCIQQRYTYLKPKADAQFGEGNVLRVANDELLALCQDQNITLLAYSPLIKGAYTRSDRALPDQYQTVETKARLALLHEIAQEIGASANQVVLAWMRQSTPSVIPIAGASRVEQLQENVHSLKIQLSAQQMERLNSAGLH